ncbi:Fe2+-dependent dioxygenase [Piscinibacter sp.]|uniref:Fe2+-dependent dioxygenase n=1 Tax=Piscinibacter sp. TaxID=1903157 RepID=UPI001DDDE2C4|nr:Fe2+-dependent dioxygenase [Piscinibacter sp.]MBK7530903.1 Fe2+-dependent dioxygenase [Piscinibacter sp.]MBL0091599.1 Fe2+-dependent dioxygenase [Piscinibacter sp.]
MLIRIPAVLEPEALARARQLLEGAPWEPGELTAGTQAALVKNNLQLPATCAQALALQALVLGALERHPLFFSATLPKKVFPPMFNRYEGAHNTYGDHVDKAVRYAPGTGVRVRTDVSCTLFLAEPDSYDGGELVIADTFGEQRVKLAAGDAVVYPGTSVHRVEPVTRGARLASFFWIESMVRSDEQRRLLHDMDRALMRLRARDGESDEAVALTGTYHNLLRLWADT